MGARQLAAVVVLVAAGDAAAELRAPVRVTLDGVAGYARNVGGHRFREVGIDLRPSTK